MAALLATSGVVSVEVTLIAGEAGPNRGARAASLQFFADDVAAWNETVHTLQSGGFHFGHLNLPKWPGRVFFLTGIS